MLVDAGARDFTDPTPSKIIETPPAISFTVSTAKFEGRVTILYDRGGDTYVVELHRQNGESVELVDRHDEVYFDMLGEVLERLIDDGRWRQIDVSILDARPASARPSRHDAPQRNRAVRLTEASATAFQPFRPRALQALHPIGWRPFSFFHTGDFIHVTAIQRR